MAEWNSNNRFNNEVKSFALVLNQTKHGDRSHFLVKWQNYGVAEGDTITAIETWLKSVKDDFKNNVSFARFDAE